MAVTTHRERDDLPVAIVGGGLAGLSAAVTLAGRGHRVVLFEANEWLGGKAAVLERDGFRFDMGPTILTLPRVLERVFAEAGRDLRTELDLLPLDPQWRCFFDDGSVIDLVADVDDMAQRIDAFAPGKNGGAGYRRYIAISERLHAISERFFFWKSVAGVRDTFDLKSNMTWATLSDLMALRMGKSFGRVVRDHVPDARVAQMIDHFAQYVGSNPFESPAVLASIAHMQTGDGVWYPRGGTAAVPAALARVAGELGVKLRTSTPVSRIESDGRRVSAVVTAAGERVAVKAVISNMDAVRTYGELLEPGHSKRLARTHSLEPACSGVVFYLGLDRAYPHLAHHDFVFSRDAHEEFDHIYRRGEPAPDPTCYLAAPARTEEGVAPPGGEALYILVHAPYLRPHHDWQAMLPAYRKVIFDKLARCAGLADLESRIKFEHHLTPQDIHDRYRVLNGAIYGLASHGKYTGAFKPGNRRRDVPGLYLAGGAAHPGPGMPMVLMSAGSRPTPWIATMRPSPRELTPEALRSATWLRFFRFALGRQLRRSFHAVRLAKPGVPPVADDLPLIVFFNHPSWWDGAAVPLVVDRLFPTRRIYGPIDAEALERYGFMRRLGFFPVRRDSYAGAATFLKTGRRLLSRPDTLFCLTPEGTFADPRQRPIRLQRGLAALIASVPRVTVLPVAVEYPFWTERMPEALFAFGQARVIGVAGRDSIETIHETLETLLTDALDRLRLAAVSRDPERFETLFDGAVGVGGMYDLGRRLGSWSRGRRFDATHDRAGAMKES